MHLVEVLEKPEKRQGKGITWSRAGSCGAWDVPRQKDGLPAGEALCKCKLVSEQMLDGKSV